MVFETSATYFYPYLSRRSQWNMNKVEVVEIEKAVNEAELIVRELSDLQLALVGGGCGESIIS